MKQKILVLLILFVCVIHGLSIQNSPLDRNPLASANICAFNVQVFGVEKMKNAMVVDALLKIFLKYDIIFMQEIRDSSGTAIATFFEKLNERSGSAYSMLLSERLGRSSSKEQYAYFFRKKYITVTNAWQFPVALNWFERPPYIVQFRISKTDNNKNFASNVIAVGIHVKPDDAVKEIDKLRDVYTEITKNPKFTTGNILFMGDFNAGCSYVPDHKWKDIRLRNETDKFKWFIGDDADTTVTNSVCPYDRFVGTKSVQGTASVFKFDKEMGMSQADALKVSDHYPIVFNMPLVKVTKKSRNK